MEDEAPVAHDAEKVRDIGQDIKKTLNRLVIATCLLYAFLIGGAYYVWMQSQHNTSALCAVRHEAEKRVQNSKDFLKAHPGGFAGISPAVIQKGIIDSQATVDALSDLNC